MNDFQRMIILLAGMAWLPCSGLLAQAVPPFIPYQGVARDDNQVVTGPVGLRFILHQGSPGGPVVFEEVHTAATNPEGVFAVFIGEQNPAAFGLIDWAQGPFFLQVGLDPQGGSDYADLGTTQVLSVPYAFHAASASTALDDQDRDPANEIQTLTLSGLDLTLSAGGGTVTLPDAPVYLAGSGIDISNNIITNTAPADTPTLSLNGLELSVNPGGSKVILPAPGSSNWSVSGANIARTTGNVGIGVAAIDNHRLAIKKSMVMLNDLNQIRTRIGANDFTAGRIETFGANNSLNVSITSSGENNGRVEWFNSDNNARLISEVNADGAGQSAYYGPNGNYNIRLFSQEGDWGAITLHNQQSNIRGYFTAYSEYSENGRGYLATYGPNNQLNVIVSSADGNDNSGGVAVFNAGGIQRAAIYVDPLGNGTISANVKSFRMPHPNDPSRHIWYACIEGPEAAAYERGTATLVDGEAFVPFSNHFGLVVNPGTMTVSLTPHSAESMGLAVVEKTPAGIRVRELMRGNGSYDFDWEVKGVRKGFEDYQVIRDAREGNLYKAPLPGQLVSTKDGTDD